MAFRALRQRDGLRRRNLEALGQPPEAALAFERVQDVLRGHALAGDRAQKHEHHLKGSIYCTCGGRLLFSRIRGHGGLYDYFTSRARRAHGVDCPGRYMPIDEIQAAVERYYAHIKLTATERARVRRVVERYAGGKQQTAQRESGRASRRLEELKHEQQRLLPMSYRDLVDDEVLAIEQERIKQERAQAMRWAKAAARDAGDIKEALEEALRLSEEPQIAYRRGRPMTRRMLNQAILPSY